MPLRKSTNHVYQLTITNSLYQTVNTNADPATVWHIGVLCAPVLHPCAAMECVCKVCTAPGTCSIPHRSWP